LFLFINFLHFTEDVRASENKIGSMARFRK
jgi:hypothetical protein